MSRPPLLVARADGGPGIGAGHLGRTLALTRAWRRRHGEVRLVSESPPAFWTDRFLAAGATIASPGEGWPAGDAAVVDGYHLAGAVATSVGRPVLLVDDANGAGTGGRGTTIVVDQNLEAQVADYPAARSLLLGPRYALLEPLDHPITPRDATATPRRVLVIIGGSPSAAAAALGERIVEDVRDIGLDARVLRGTDDLPGALDEADVAVSAAGTVSWELCRRGIPSVLFALASNQTPVVAQLAAAGAAEAARPQAASVSAALRRIVTEPERRRHLSSTASALVDGFGARRVAACLRAELVQLRDADQRDAPLLHRWSSDPGTRAASFSTGPIAWEDHVAWLEARLADAATATYIGLGLGGEPLGVVRFDSHPAGAEIGITVAPEARGQGWGGALIVAACGRSAARRGAVPVIARIRAENGASVGAFVDADFDEVVSEEPGVLRYARRLDGGPARS